MPKADEVKRRERDVYDSVAEVFANVWARYTARFAADLIDLMFPHRGESALDLAGGTGAAGLKLAERIGKDGSVTIVDISPGMLREAEKLAAARGLSNVSTRVMDAEQLDFPDASFDLIVCSFGVMFFPNVSGAIREASRVLKPGGRIGFTVWSDPERTPFISWPATAAIRRIAPAPVRLLLKTPGIGGPLLKWLLRTRGSAGPSGLRFSRKGSLEKHLVRAGFEPVRRELRAYPLEFASFDEFWDAMLKGTPAAEMVKRIPAQVLEQIKAEARGKLANPNTGGVYVHNEAALILAKKAP